MWALSGVLVLRVLNTLTSVKHSSSDSGCNAVYSLRRCRYTSIRISAFRMHVGLHTL